MTGYLSYGFNDIGLFSTLLPNGQMDGTGGTASFKESAVPQPSDMVAINDVSGAVDVTDPGGISDAAWQDTVWSGAAWNSGSNSGTSPTAGDNARIASAFAKHSNRINVVYVDGHAAPSLASQLYYYQWYGYFGPLLSTTNFPSSGSAVPGTSAVAPVAWDSLQWSSAPE
jgi:prepilin-type processing-associated H-X9-DG protein